MPINAEETPEKIVFTQRARALCAEGYIVEGSQPTEVDPETEASPSDAFVTYARSPNTYCTDDEASTLGNTASSDMADCKAECDADALCVAFELTCDDRCLLLQGCEDARPSACGVLFTKQILPAERVMEFECQADGTIANVTGSRCMPVCGDGRLVPTDHLAADTFPEQCDDGNQRSGDGCSAECRVEIGFVCTGGGLASRDACRKSVLFAQSALRLEVSGRRQPDAAELALASEQALAAALRAPRRDVEIVEVTTSEDVPADETASPPQQGGTDVLNFDLAATTTPSPFHSLRLEARVVFKVKISDPSLLSIDEVEGAIKTVGVLIPKLMVAYTDHTSLSDLYVRVATVEAPVVVGERSAGVVDTGFSLSAFLQDLLVHVGPLIFYFFLLTTLMPFLTYMVVVRQREYGLAGRYVDVSPEFKDGWSVNICAWMENKLMCLGLIVCLPARMANTWDTLGLMPYWEGVRKALCCCFLYLGGCCLCGAVIPGSQRSEMRDFFGFGDKVKGNLELSDYLCYLCCPLCCVIQEARHIDMALEVLPPPLDEVEEASLAALARHDRKGSKEVVKPAVEEAPSEMIMDVDCADDV